MPWTSNLASKFRSRLIQAYHSGGSSGDIREDAFSEPNKTTTDNAGINGTARWGETPPEMICTPGFEAGQGGYQPVPKSAGGPNSGCSPSGFSLAFPPLPGSFQNQVLAAPDDRPPEDMQPGFAGQPGVPPMPGMNGFGHEGTNDPDLNSFLDQYFPPEQRVSMLSRFMPEP